MGGVFLNDNIPPGFKYIKNRVILNSTPIAEPSGQRPLLFNVGSIGVGATVVLQYQLVIGSGVTMGNYQNTAKEPVILNKLTYFFYIISVTFIGTAIITGQELDWFRSPLICFLLITGCVCLLFFIVRCLNVERRDI